MPAQIVSGSVVIDPRREFVPTGRHQVMRKFKTGYKTGYVVESKVIETSYNKACSRLFRFNV